MAARVRQLGCSRAGGITGVTSSGTCMGLAFPSLLAHTRVQLPQTEVILKRKLGFPLMLETFQTLLKHGLPTQKSIVTRTPLPRRTPGAVELFLAQLQG